MAWQLFDNACGVSSNQGVRRNIPGDDAACAHQRVLANGNAAKNHRAGANGRAALDPRGNASPVGLGLETAARGGGARKPVIDEGDIVADKNLVLNGHAFADEGMTGYLAPRADFGALLYFDKSADLCVITHFTAVKVGKRKDADTLAEFDVCRD